MYYIYGISGPSLLIESTDSMIIINPRRMCCRVMVVILCVCLSVTELTATYLVCKLKVWRYKVPYTWHSKRTV